MGKGDRRMAETGGRPQITCAVACSGEQKGRWDAYWAFQVLPSWLSQTRLLSFTISKAGGPD
jgi:hypothetical protein